jgi:chloramphenicol 3-O-phosphotransferase
MFEEAALADRSLVFTFAPEASVPENFVDEAVAAITLAGGKVHFVGLTCEAAEQERRIENPDRKQYNKLASLQTLRAINAADKGFGRIPPADLTLDTTATPPDETAQRIIDHFALTPDRGG